MIDSGRQWRDCAGEDRGGDPAGHAKPESGVGPALEMTLAVDQDVAQPNLLKQANKGSYGVSERDEPERLTVEQPGQRELEAEIDGLASDRVGKTK